MDGVADWNLSNGRTGPFGHEALSLPAIIAGVVVVSTGSLELTERGYGIAVILLAALAFAGLARRGRVQIAPVNVAGVRAEPHAVGCPCMG